MNSILLVIVSLFIGLGLKLVKGFPNESSKTLNLFVIYVSLPSMVLLKVKDLEISTQLLFPILTPWVMIVVLSLAILFIAKKMEFSRQVTGAMLLVVTLGNTSFVGVPFVSGFFGDEYVVYALIYDQLGTFLGLVTFGTIVIALYGSGEKPTISATIKKTIMFPPFIALILATFLRGMEYHESVLYILKTLSNTLVPIALIAVGLQLEIKVPSHEVKPLFISIFLKIIATPIIVYIFAKNFTDMDVVAKITVIESGMGSMITAGAVAILAGLAPRLSAAIVGYSILGSFITVPIIFFLLE